ncbi:hypothetical protein SAMN02744778_02156 [Pantoea sp. GL120224-02]|nr:hypothetical protein SAMN02744778_02156 [Pantoea sp. GL120224-02]
MYGDATTQGGIDAPLVESMFLIVCTLVAI